MAENRQVRLPDISIPWSDLQPKFVKAPWWERFTPKGFRRRRNAKRIDAAIARVTAWNQAHPEAPIKLKLRVFAGIHTPE